MAKALLKWPPKLNLERYHELALEDLKEDIDAELERRAAAAELERTEALAKTVKLQRYVQERTRCGKANCKCTRGQLHGPYWMLVKTYGNGRVEKEYIGKHLPPGARAGHVPVDKPGRSARRGKRAA